MTSLTLKKPFYLHPPWNILFEFHKLEKLTPWKVNIAYLLTSFLEEMNKTGKIDFRASGVALDSSALIFLMKSKLLLKLEEPPLPKSPQDFVPPPLFLPLRHELTSTTIRHLLEVLDDVLKSENLLRPPVIVQEPILPTASEIMSKLDVFMMEIEVEMEKLHATLVEMVKGTGIVEFSTLIKGSLRLAAIRTFITLLFLAQEGKVNLWQDEESEEIYITIGDLNLAESRKTSVQ
ncbi:hypothetical protein KEJ15_03560 [Candidatus Bathyarchaeota archaeon]|nr:hypothetical protein [Candidatus Bathyarchaeota archaeon]